MRIGFPHLLVALALASCNAGPSVVDGAIPVGSGEQVARVGGQALPVYTFRPAGCTPTGILLVFHGVDRNADAYRDDAIPVARHYCLVTIAPLFEAAHFPGWRYQRGGVVHDGVLLPAADWTTALVPDIAAWGRSRLAQPGLPYSVMGHSAGAQFLSRVAAYQPGEARRFVIANPSTWVRASTDVPAPYGFGPPFPPAEAEAALRRYLALPITVLLGADDTGSRNLASSEEAEAQGATRVERGRTVFAEAQRAAQARGWAFGWRLSVRPGVGHDARRMLSAPGAFEALGP